MSQSAWSPHPLPLELEERSPALVGARPTMATVEGGDAMEADLSGDSSPLSSIGDEQPSSPVQMAQLSSPVQVAQPSSPVQVVRPPSPAVAAVGEETKLAIQEDVSPLTPRRSRRNCTVRTEEEKKQPAKKVTVKRTPKKRKWDAENMIIDPKSPLASADLRVRIPHGSLNPDDTTYLGELGH